MLYENRLRIYGLGLVIFSCIGAAAATDGNMCAIEKAVIHNMQPAGVKNPPNINRVAIEGGYAVASWIDGEAGGIAVLRKKARVWSILSNGGGWDSYDGLVSQGVPASIAEKLANDFGMPGHDYQSLRSTSDVPSNYPKPNHPRGGAINCAVGMFAAATVSDSKEVAQPSSGSLNPATLIVVLRSDHSTYRSGDKIRLAVALRNNGSKEVDFVVSAPWHLVDLVITDAQQRRVTPDRGINSVDYPSTHGFILGPGKTVDIGWLGSTWIDLSNWGYSELKPGRYTIRAIPMTAGNFKPDFKTPRSTALCLTIDK